MIDRVVQTVRAILLAFGVRGVVRRLLYVAKLRSGWLRWRLPMRDDYDAFEPMVWGHELAVPDLRDRDDDVVARAEALLEGQLRFYGWTDRQVDWPPRWHRNVFTGHEYPLVHWTEISDHDPDAGDIKDVWEISRFTWVFLLARAYARTGEDRWAEAFWVGLESWMEHNPPNTGVNWRCAQEASLRGMAIQFGLAVFAGNSSTTPERRRVAHQLLEATRQRVRPTISYALSQRNNHAISELAFLLTLQRRDRRLNRLLRESIEDQFYADGSYSQQSPTYQRLALHTLFWLDLVTELQQRTKVVVDWSLDCSAQFLERIIDPVSSHAPNYGPNDGALLLDLDTTARADFTPTLELLGVGHSSSEAVTWLGTRDAPSASRASNPSTYVTLTVGGVHVLMRCGTGRHRPAHDDQLAVDVWLHGENVVPDPGTYRYTTPSPWANALTGADVHARPRVAGAAPRRFARFLRGPTTAATCKVWIHPTGGLVAVRAALATREGLLTRTVAVDEKGVSILDEANGTEARGRMNHPAGTSHQLRISARRIQHIVATEHEPTSGWLAPHYGQLLGCGATEYELGPDAPAAIVIGEPSRSRTRRIEELAASRPRDRNEDLR